MKRFIFVAVLLVLAGCGSLTNAQSSCSSANSNFSPMWDCIKGRVASGNAGMMNNDLGLRYMAFGDSLNERYKAGKISNSDAKLLLAQELSRANSEFEARQPKRLSTTCRQVFNTVVCD